MPINWSTVILNLRAAGVSVKFLQNKVKMDEATIRRLARGEVKEPRFSQGLELLDLHERFCAESHDLKLIGY